MDEIVTHLLERAEQSCLAMSFLKNEKTLKKIIDIIELLKESEILVDVYFRVGMEVLLLRLTILQLNWSSDLRKIETRLEHIH